MRTLCVLLVLSLLLAVPSVARAEDAPTEKPKTVNLVLQKVDVIEAIQKLARMAGRNVVVSPKVKGKVTLTFRDTPFLEALQQVAKACGCVVVEEEHGLITLVPREWFARTKLDPIHTRAETQKVLEQVAKANHAANSIKQLTKSLEAAQKLNATLQRSLARDRDRGDRVLVDKLTYLGKDIRFPTPGPKALRAPVDTQAPGLVQLPEFRIVPKNGTKDVIIVDIGRSVADIYTKRVAQFKKAGALLEAAGDKDGAARAYKRSQSASAMAKKLRRAREMGLSPSTNAAAYRKPFDALRTEVRALRDEVRELTGLVRQLLEKNR